MKPQIKLIDTNFSHHPTTGPSVSTSPNNDLAPSFFDWYRGDEDRDVTIFTDNCLDQVDLYIRKTKYKIAWLLEPRALVPSIYEKIKTIHQKFDLIISHDADFINEMNCKNFKYIPFAGCWIKESDFSLYEKTKNISIISSYKRQLPGHMLRHEIISKYGNRLDGVFGNGYNRIADKVDGIRDFRFHVVIENTDTRGFWTEKLVDAFACGSIPIYYGNGPDENDIEENFIKQGMLFFKTIEEFDFILNNWVNEKFYNENIEYIKANFELAKRYRIIEDVIWNSHLKEIVI